MIFAVRFFFFFLNKMKKKYNYLNRDIISIP